MAKQSSKPRERASILLRVDPELADWFASAAESQGRSRTKLMEMWLEALRDEVERIGKLEGGADPFGAVDDLGEALVQKVIDLGMANSVLKFAREQQLAERRAEVEEAKRERKGRR